MKDIAGLYPKAMSVAGGYVFIENSRDAGELNIYNSSNLSTVGFIDKPMYNGLIMENGWLDIPHAIQAFKRSNGQNVILVEDNYTGKNIVYQWCPTGNWTSSTVATVSASPTASGAVAVDVSILMLPLPLVR